MINHFVAMRINDGSLEVVAQTTQGLYVEVTSDTDHSLIELTRKSVSGTDGVLSKGDVVASIDVISPAVGTPAGVDAARICVIKSNSHTTNVAYDLAFSARDESAGFEEILRLGSRVLTLPTYSSGLLHIASTTPNVVASLAGSKDAIIIGNTTADPVFAAVSGDATMAYDTGSAKLTISNGAVTYGKIQNVSATDKLLGRVSSGAGSIEEITCTSFARSILDDVDAAAVRSTIGAGTGSGTVTSVTAGSGLSGGTISTSGTVALDINALTAATSLALADTIPLYSSLDAANKKFSLRQFVPHPGICGGRLTLSSTLPVTISDVTAATSVYFLPHVGNTVALFESHSGPLGIYGFSNPSLSLSGLSGVYDIFAYQSSGTVTLYAVAWASDTARATNIVQSSGIWVLDGDYKYRYLGTIKTSATGQCEDSLAKRFVWNATNRVHRRFKVSDSTSHAYNSTTLRQWRATASNQIEWVCGLAEDALAVTTSCRCIQTNAGQNMFHGFGLDSTTTYHQDRVYGTSHATSVFIETGLTQYVDTSIGYHYAALLQESTATGTATFTVGRITGTVLA